MHPVTPSSSRILYDVPCAVCRDHSSGKHYGVYACDGCAGFFKRSVRRDRRYVCKARVQGGCLVDKVHRNQCRHCRFEKCLNAGMNRDAVQHERGPRNSTIRRQMALFMKDPPSGPDMGGPVPPPLNLALPKHNLMPPETMPLYPPYSYPTIGLFNPPDPILPLSTLTPLQPNPFLHTPSDHASICEAAARLLFTNIKLFQNIPATAHLTLDQRVMIIQNTWTSVFILGFAQFLYPIALNSLIDRNKQIVDNKKEVKIFESALEEISNINPDANEYACLRAILLFEASDDEGSSSPGSRDTKSRKLQNVAAITLLHDQSIFMLKEYCLCKYPLQLTRSSKLLSLLPIIKNVPSNIIVELFFRATVGDTPIERILADMYTSGRITE